MYFQRIQRSRAFRALGIVLKLSTTALTGFGVRVVSSDCCIIRDILMSSVVALGGSCRRCILSDKFAPRFGGACFSGRARSMASINIRKPFDDVIPNLDSASGVYLFYIGISRCAVVCGLHPSPTACARLSKGATLPVSFRAHRSGPAAPGFALLGPVRLEG